SIAAGTGPYANSYRPATNVSKAAIFAVGTGYKVGDTLTILGGTSLTPAKLQVTKVNAGAITGVSIIQAGAYIVEPFNAASVSPDPSNPLATGAILTLSYSGLKDFITKNYLGTWTLRIKDNVV